MSIQTIKTNLIMRAVTDYDRPGYPTVWRPAVATYHDSAEYDDKHQMFVRAIEFQCEVPDNFDPTARLVDALLREKAKMSAEFAQKVAAINEQLARLQAIEHTEAA